MLAVIYDSIKNSFFKCYIKSSIKFKQHVKIMLERMWKAKRKKKKKSSIKKKKLTRRFCFKRIKEKLFSFFFFFFSKRVLERATWRRLLSTSSSNILFEVLRVRLLPQNEYPEGPEHVWLFYNLNNPFLILDFIMYSRNM